MERIKLEVKLTGRFDYSKPGYCPWQTVYMSIYKFVDASGKVYVWNTSGTLFQKVFTEEEKHDGCWCNTDGKGRRYYEQFITKGSKLVISASVKGEGEYKGEPQTELTRVKVEEILFLAESEEEKAARLEAEKEAKKQAQLDSITENDLVWTMPYSQYKAHYADCETVIDSFEKHETEYGRATSPATIKVIIREGRLKNSGVRGKHFSNYWIEFVLNGNYIHSECYRAVCVENAIEQAKKRHPDGTCFSFDGIDTRC